MDNDTIDTGIEVSPYALFSVDDVVYGVSSSHVLSIEILSEPTPLINAPDYILGIIDFRGDMIPLIGLRKLFGVGKRGEVLRVFMKDRRKDHEVWMSTLEDAIKNDREPALNYDHHKCKFGAWADTFVTQNNSLNAHLSKMRNPHAMMHKTGKIIAEKAKTNKAEAMEMLETLKTTHVAEILRLIDECADVYLEGIREMLLVLSVNGLTKGVVVDDIVSVEYINKFLDMPQNATKSKYVRNLAKRDKDDSPVLLIDETLIIDL